MNLKTGKAPAKYDKKQLHLEHFSVAAPRVAPEGFDSSKGMFTDFDSWGMLGNDQFGDCVWAGSDHETMILTFLGSGNAAAFSSKTALGDYSMDTGFNPNDPSTDQGTDMGEAMRFRRHVGVEDTTGNRHKIGAYLALEPGNFHQLLQALYSFQVVGIGIEFPQSAMDQFNADRPWTLVHGSSTEGGHYIPACGRPTAESVFIITWGRKMRMTKRFYETYNDESYVFISEEDLKGGKSPEGYDLSQLTTILSEL